MKKGKNQQLHNNYYNEIQPNINCLITDNEHC